MHRNAFFVFALIKLNFISFSLLSMTEEHDAGMWVKEDHAEKHERDIRKDKGYRAVYINLARDLEYEEEALSKKDRRRLFEQAKRLFIKKSLSRYAANKLRTKPEDTRRYKKIRHALWRCSYEHEKINNLQPQFFDLDEEQISAKKRGEPNHYFFSTFKSNAWQPDSMDVLQEKRLADAQLCYRSCDRRFVQKNKPYKKTPKKKMHGNIKFCESQHELSLNACEIIFMMRTMTR